MSSDSRSSSPYVIRPSEMPSYGPANHTWPENTRLVGPDVNGSRYFGIALGDIERNEGSPPYALGGLGP